MSWIILNGELIQTEAREVKSEPVSKPYPLCYFTLEDDDITLHITRDCKNTPVSYPYPLSYWRQSKYINEGYPFHEMFRGIEYVEPPTRYDVLRINENVRVISLPHGLDKTFPITKMEIPLDKPEETKYTLNEEKKTSLTEVMAETNMETWREIQSQPTLTTMLASAKKNATELIKSGDGGYVTLKRNDNGIIEEILISDEADYTIAQKIWRWNKNGFGYSKTGYDGEYGLAITMDGAIVADKITSGTMYADHIRGGILKMGGIDNVDGVIQVLGGDGKEKVLLSSEGGKVHGLLTNINDLSGNSIVIDDGMIMSYSSYDDYLAKKDPTAFINTTWVYQDRTRPAITMNADALVLNVEWLGISDNRTSVTYTTQDHPKVEYVSNVSLKSDGTLNVEKKTIKFINGIMVTTELPNWNPDE